MTLSTLYLWWGLNLMIPLLIGYKVDEFTCTWLVELLVAQTYILPGFMGKVSSQTHYCLNQGVRIIHLWTKQLQTLSMVLILSSLTPLRHWNWMHHLMNLMSLLLQSLQGSNIWLLSLLILLNCHLLLASNLINYAARLGYYVCLYHWHV